MTGPGVDRTVPGVFPDDAPTALADRFWAYEQALMDDDQAAMDELFAPGDQTLRADAAGVLVGHDVIGEFRARRGGAPQRTVDEVHVRMVGDDHAWIIARTRLHRGGSGLQSQLWARQGDAPWRVLAAHVSTTPAAASPSGDAAGPTPLDRRVWRVVGDPLVAPLASGPLDGLDVAVKDLFAVAGHAVGAGNPAWEHTAPIEADHAQAVRALLSAGASVAGITRTDEFAYSLAGANAHFGQPPNPAAPGRISGGSSSGSATAVAAGQVDIGLGTDTGGSIRVPAAYQGLFGIRTTHGAVSTNGLMPLAPSFDTVGWLTRDVGTLRAVGDVLLPRSVGGAGGRVLVLRDLVTRAEPDVAQQIRALGRRADAQVVSSRDVPWQQWMQTFVTRQSCEAWQSHGWWLAGRLETLGDDVRSRFVAASQRTQEESDASWDELLTARERIRAMIGDDIWIVPAAPTVAPAIGDDLGPIREATLQVTCVAGLGGLPSVAIPMRTTGGLPCAAALVAGPGRDHDLLDLAAVLTTS